MASRVREVESHWVVACTRCGHEDTDCRITDGEKPPRPDEFLWDANPCARCGSFKLFATLCSWGRRG